ncbi:MAG: NAD-dependent DNA ligase LigA [Bacteroidia bacterium]|nr:NAD-dependent DNA ligase LigA [Bacteroidia bacterium]
MAYTNAEQKKLIDISKAFLVDPNRLNNGKIKEEIEVLKRVIVYHEWRYYVKNDPVLSDKEYDILFDLLKDAESEYPQLVTQDSPTQRVSVDIVEGAPTVRHLTSMLSLANSYNAEDLNDFDAQIRRLLKIPELEDVEYCVEPKYDGGTIVLVYENDQLARAATRGNGESGELITHNIKTMRSVPLSASFSKRNISRVELRGEALIRKDIFEEVNKMRAKNGEELFANPRNAATGGLRVKNPKDSERRRIQAFLYQIGFAADDNGNDLLSSFKTHDETIQMLADLGFKVPVVERKVCKNIAEAAQFCKYWEEQRDSYPYEIDGMVVKVNDLRLQRLAGSTAHHPRWAIAYKFKAKQATSKLIDVEYQIGKIGTITPVAKIEPVQLAGVTVTSISLHNEEFITSKDIRIGDTVLVERAGDVIPYIVKSITDIRDGTEQKIVFPSTCPSCDTALVKHEGEAAWRCENPKCEAQLIQRLVYHVSKEAMDIDGFGASYIERFHELGWINSLPDIYRLNYETIASLEGFGVKSANNLREAVEKAKMNPMHRFLASLSIHHLGKKASKLIASEISSVFDLIDWDEARYISIKDIGPTVAQNARRFFTDEENIQMLRDLESLGVNLEQTEEDRPRVVQSDSQLNGKTILFTGTLQQMGRKAAQQLAEANGAKNISAVSGNLDFLVAGEKAGSKLAKAKALGTVKIISEKEFLALID